MRERERVVGIWRAWRVSEPRNSRIEERRTARPSAERENGVRPEPLS